MEITHNYEVCNIGAKINTKETKANVEELSLKIWLFYIMTVFSVCITFSCKCMYCLQFVTEIVFYFYKVYR